MKSANIIIFLVLLGGVVIPQPDNKNDNNKKVIDLSEIVIPLNPLDRKISQPVNEICPVEGKKIDNNLTALIYKDEIIGFCCEGCDEKFIKDKNYYENHIIRKNKSKS